MASKRIQGITIVIDGETGPLQNALKKVDTQLRKTQGNLKDINKLLKLDPGNTELLAQKQRNLQASIKTTEERLKELKSVNKTALSPDEYDALQREIIETEQKLSGLKDEYRDFGSVAKQKLLEVGNGMQELGNKITNSVQPIQDKMKAIGQSINEHVIQPIIQVGKVAAAAGIATTTALTKSAVEAKAEYEQLVGGVGKLFGDQADKVVKNAKNAYKTSGKSANDYMKSVTNFSASLISSLGGDTEKAARLADMAIRDMSDNANTFGTELESVEAAYQGFAKQQYTLLDNLKLGYGGTKEEMERLIRDAERLDETFKVTHKTTKKGKETNEELVYSYADVVKAIHVVQDNMKITGTTAAEASKTIEGSWGMVKASWTNLMTAIGTGDDVRGATKNLLTSLGTYLKDNLLPTIRTALPAIGEAVEEAWTTLKEKLPVMTRRMINWLTENIPKLGETIRSAVAELGVPLRLGLFTAISLASSALSNFIAGDNSLAGKFRKSFLDAKADIEAALKNIGDALATVWEAVSPFLKEQLKTFITDTLPKITETIKDITDGIKKLAEKFNGLDDDTKELIVKIAEGLILSIPLISTIGKVISKIGGVIKLLSGTGGIIAVIGLIAGAVIMHWDEIKAVWEVVKQKWSELTANIKSKWDTTWAQAQQTWESFKSKVNTGWENIKTKATGIIENLKGAWEGFKNDLNEKWESIKTKAGNVADAIKEKWDNFKSALVKSWESITEAASALWGDIARPIVNALHSIRDAFTSLIRKVKSAINKMNEFFRVNQRTADTDESLALTEWTGGYGNEFGEPVNLGVKWNAGAYNNPLIFTKPTVLQTPRGLQGFGDGAGAEVVLSYQKLKELVGSGAGNNVSITINTQPGQSAEDIAAAVKRIFTREMEQRSAAYA